MKIWTIGTRNRGADEFLSLLKKYGIEVIADVRRFPSSKFEHFKKENIRKILLRENIGYHHVEDLGGYRKGGYREYMKKEDYKRGLDFVKELAKENRVAIMCSEILFFRCHRRFISDSLKENGFDVIHIIDEKRCCEHKIEAQKTLEDFSDAEQKSQGKSNYSDA